MTGNTLKMKLLWSVAFFVYTHIHTLSVLCFHRNLSACEQSWANRVTQPNDHHGNSTVCRRERATLQSKSADAKSGFKPTHFFRYLFISQSVLFGAQWPAHINTSDLSFIQFIYSTIQWVFHSFLLIPFILFIILIACCAENAAAASWYHQPNQSLLSLFQQFFLDASLLWIFIDFFLSVVRSFFCLLSLQPTETFCTLQSLWNRIPFMCDNNIFFSRSFYYYMCNHIYTSGATGYVKSSIR